MSALVSTVIMATLVVGPFYLAYSLGLNAAPVGIVMSAGPLVAALMGVPAGRLTDRFGTHRMTLAGLAGMTAGALALALAPASAGILGYVPPIAVVTAGYALFQTANNTSVMKNVPAERRGVVSGVLNLSRNLGLITGASAMGAVFAFAAGTSDIADASPEAIATAMSVTFAVATGIIVAAVAITLVGQHLNAQVGAKR